MSVRTVHVCDRCGNECGKWVYEQRFTLPYPRKTARVMPTAAQDESLDLCIQCAHELQRWRTDLGRGFLG